MGVFLYLFLLRLLLDFLGWFVWPVTIPWALLSLIVTPIQMLIEGGNGTFRLD